MSEKRIVVQSGLSLPAALFLVFLVLKLTDHIDWSWVWVTAPLWLGYAAILATMAVVFVVVLIISFFDR